MVYKLNTVIRRRRTRRAERQSYKQLSLSFSERQQQEFETTNNKNNLEKAPAGGTTIETDK
ncbi:MAG: hypothetical protein LBH80_05525 [Prevotellaceae bacterium]|jgi:hypothetical protein|nr:hypothetical protein [Prevotellaceae bacterium]